MCGIAGIVNSKNNINSQQVIDMLHVIAHRGPDDEGIYASNGIGLGQRRLSIIDLTPTGHQPMVSNCENLVIVFNGEIYNHQEIKKELLHFGFQFKGTSDTETILYGFKKWGVEIFKKLNGIFGICIYNKLENKIYIARDRFGVKPLYYYYDDNNFIFSSEVKSILTQHGQKKINYKALHEFLYYGYAMGKYTLFNNIYKLLPGHFIEFNISNYTFIETPYWKHEDLLPELSTISENEAINTTKNLLENAVKRQLLSDVPVGVFLSGGIDSSAITAFATKHYNGKLKSYSAGFDFNGGHNELPLAKKIAKQYNTDHKEIMIKGGDLPSIITKLIHHHDEPFSDAANIPLFLLTQQLNGECKVILQGDGGDEMYAGYNRYSWLNNFYKNKLLFNVANMATSILPKPILKQRTARLKNIFNSTPKYKILAKLLTVETEQDNLLQIFNANVSLKMQEHNPFEFYEATYDRFQNLEGLPQKMLWIDTLAILPDQFLEKVDKSTMASSVEVRVPFLDNDLSAFAMKLPGNLKVKNGVKKYILKKALEGTVSNEVLYGPKKGFGVPYQNWLKEPLYNFFNDCINAQPVKNFKIFNYEYINKLMHQHKTGLRDNGFILWKILNLSIWLKEYNIEVE